jgi:hypothetical protein
LPRATKSHRKVRFVHTPAAFGLKFRRPEIHCG